MSKKISASATRLLCLASTVATGAACAKWMPGDWVFNLLGLSIVATLISACAVTVNLKNERRPPMSIAVVLEVLCLPSRNGEIAPGPVLWIFFVLLCFLAGMLGTMILLPLIH